MYSYTRHRELSSSLSLYTKSSVLFVTGEVKLLMVDCLLFRARSTLRLSRRVVVLIPGRGGVP